MIALYDPSDPMWYINYDDGLPWLWHLKKIQADLAWDITKGDPSIRIAILDTWFDINHPDLYNQLLYQYDPYDNQPFYSSNLKNNHGTKVASYVAAETDGGGGLASVGFNCKIIPYKHGGSSSLFLQRAQHASLVMNADIITSSAGVWHCPKNLDFNIYEGIAVREILNNGTVIVMPAGNGKGTHCMDTINNQHQPWRPLHPYYDERIIIVTSTDRDDNHTYYNQSANEDQTHSHYPYVDICAPGYNTMGASGTLLDDGTPDPWPYYGFSTGTSFSTPIVAGVCGLIKSINKCFTPEDIQYIIKTTADPVADGIYYPGQLGAGRINAYNAVQMALTYLNDISINTSQYWAYPRNIYSNVIIESGTTLSITSTVKLANNCKITVQPGAKLIIDHGTLTNACPGELWQGITVYGDPNLPFNYGYVEVRNGGTIENAIAGITVKAGAKMYAENAKFVNNRTGVNLEYLTSGQTGMASSFLLTDFIKDNNFFGNPITFDAHIKAQSSGNIDMKGCTFSGTIMSTGAHCPA